MRDYELTFVVRSDLEEPELNAVIDRVKGLVSDNGGEVARLDLWGTRRLAYPINNVRDGQYVFMLAQLPPNAVVGLDRSLNFVEDVLRHLVIRAEE
jgi:small subunit ribosomal protein S6